MSDSAFDALIPASLDWQDNTPVATTYNDSYFSRQDGMAESRYVFLDGNHLSERFPALPNDGLFVIGETGFGTGLNCLLAAQQFLDQAPSCARLHLISVEQHPLQRDDLARSHYHRAGDPLLTALLQQYPAPAPGTHRLRLHPRIHLTLLYGDVNRVLPLYHSKVDAWFLDGFAPSCNPQMWQPAVFAQLARLSHPGTTVATFTAAGFVRRGLIDAGFVMSKRKGFAHKRHMLVGHRPHAASQHHTPQRTTHCGQALVIGAGLAGSTTARALAERGWQVTVTDPGGIAGGASGNHAGVVYSSPSPHLTAQNRFYLNSYCHALRWLSHHDFPVHHRQGRLNGVLQHGVTKRQQDKLQGAMDSGIWPQELLHRHDDQAVCLSGGGYLSPALWCEHLLDHPAIARETHRVISLAPGAPATATLENAEQRQADAIVVCMAGASQQLDGLGWLPLKTIRGQVSYCIATKASQQWQHARCHGGYLTPAMDGLHCVGATFDLHDCSLASRHEDDQRNLNQLHQHLPQQWQQLGGSAIQISGHRTALRCQSTDFLPLCGPWPVADAIPHHAAQGLYLNLAQGSRGITGTPLCADLLADQISQTPLPVDQELVDALDPARFIIRQRRKNPEWKPC